jgi:hypothetical protein
MGRPTEEEALKLVKAFYSITDREKRAEVIALAKKYAEQSEGPESKRPAR